MFSFFNIAAGYRGNKQEKPASPEEVAKKKELADKAAADVRRMELEKRIAEGQAEFDKQWVAEAPERKARMKKEAEEKQEAEHAAAEKELGKAKDAYKDLLSSYNKLKKEHDSPAGKEKPWALRDADKLTLKELKKQMNNLVEKYGYKLTE